MGRIKPRTVSELMNIANRFADDEDACNNKRTRSPEDDRGNRYNSQRRRSRNCDNYGSHIQVAAEYKDNNLKALTAGTQVTAATAEKTQAIPKGSSPGDPGNTIHHQTIC
jgi:hypothetical protein